MFIDALTKYLAGLICKSFQNKALFIAETLVDYIYNC